MLEKLRRGASGWIAKILLGLLILSFAVWGVADMITGRSSTTLAKVGGQTISETQFREAQQMQMDMITRQFGSRPGPELAKPIAIATLQRLMSGAAIQEHAEKLGITVSNKAVVAGVEADPSFFGSDGKFSRSQLEAALNSLRMSERQFVEERRKDTIRSQLTESLASATMVPDELVKLIYAWRNDKRKVSYFPVVPATDAKAPEPTDEELKTAYEQSKGRYIAPESRRIGVLVLSADDIKKRLVIPDAEIAASYEHDKALFSVAERRHVLQIAFPDKAAAEAALKEIQGGKAFVEAAKATGASEKDIDLGKLTKQDMIDSAIAAVAFGLDKDKVSEPVAGRFSTVLLLVTEIEPGRQKTLDEVKESIRDRLATERVGAEVQKLHDAVDEQKLKGKTLKEIGEALNVRYLDIPGITANGTASDGKAIEGLPDAARIAQTAFQSAVGLESEVVEIANQGYAWVDVLAVTPRKQKEFSEVRDDVKKAWVTTEADKALRTKADELVKRIDGGEAIAEVAKSIGAEVKTSEDFNRRTSVPGLSAAAVTRAFALAKGKAASVAGPTEAERVVMMVNELVPAAEPKKEEIEALNRELRQQLQSEVIGEYVMGLRNSYGATYDQSMLDRVLGVQSQP